VLLIVAFLIPFTHGTVYGYQRKKNVPKDSKRKRDSLTGDPYNKFFSRRLAALVYHQEAQMQPLNLFSAKSRDEPVVKHLPAAT
jgi:hypothetical protein